MNLTQEWYNERLAELSASLSLFERDSIRADYEEISGRAWEESFSPNCPNCYRDAILIINAKIRNMSNEKSGGYVLKSGIVFKYKGKTITHLNITAEAAEWFIKQDLRNRDKFVELANDYDSYEQNSLKTE